MKTGERFRLAVALTASFVLTMLCVAALLPALPAHPDWLTMRAAGGVITSGDLAWFTTVPEAQVGPLPLLLAMLPRSVYMTLVIALLPATLALAVHRRPRGAILAASLGAFFAAAPWSFYALEGHIDEALVAVAGAGVVLAARGRPRPVVMVALFVLGIAAKPTAIVLLPLVFLVSRRAGGWALLAGGAVWAPFVLPDVPAFLAAGGGIVVVMPGSLVELAGLADPGDPYPGWVRPAMLVVGLLVCWLLARRHGAAAAVVGVWAVRALLEPGAFASYSTILVVAAVAVAAEQPGRWFVVPLAFGSWLLPIVWWPMTVELGAARLVLIGTVAAGAVALRSQRKAAARRFDACADLAPSTRRPPVMPSPSLPR